MFLNILKNLEDLLTNSIKDCVININKKNFGIICSGGVDSSILAFLSKKYYNITCYTAGKGDSEDIKFVKRLKNENPELNFKIIEIDEEQVKESIDILLKILKDNNIKINLLNISTGILIYFVSKAAKKDNIDVLCSGQGADEIFGGYYRYLKMSKDDLIKNMKTDVENIYINNLNREIAICNYNKIKIKYPYLDEKFLNYALSLPLDLKIHEIIENKGKVESISELEEFMACIDEIDGKKFIRKYILRKFAEYIGVPDFIVKRKKKAIQYGSKSEVMLKRLLKCRKFA